MSATKKQIGVGVIGLGFIGRTHLAAYDAAAAAGVACRVVAVCDQNPDRRSGLASSTGGHDELESRQSERLFDPADVRGYANVEELLADDQVDLVSICTPTDTHVSVAIAALDAGKHVLLEKPVAVRSADVARLRERVERSDRLCMPAMCMRFWPGWDLLKESIDDRRYGRVRSAVFQRVGNAPGWSGFYADESRSGGALVDTHVHDADFVRWCFGDPQRVRSAGTTRHVLTHYEFDEGPELVVAEGGWIEAPGFPFNMRYRVEFERAALEFEMSRDKPLRISEKGESRPIELPAHNGYDVEVRELLATIAGGTRALRATIADAERVAILLEAERESLHKHAPIEVGVDRYSA